MSDLQTVSDALAAVRNKMLRKANVIGIGVGFKETEGRVLSEPALKVLVVDKLPVSALAAQDVVPKTVAGVLTDVTPVGRIYAYDSPRDRFRPAPAGVSIGHYAVTAGTFGALVRDARTGELLILSNNHVLANCNNAQVGDTVLQPAAADGGKNPQDRIAVLDRFVKLQFKNAPAEKEAPTCPLARFAASFLNAFAALSHSQTRLVTTQSYAVNLVDAAAAKPINNSLISDEIRGIGRVNGTTSPALGMKVKKSGRTTGYTEGEITILDATIEVGYAGQAALFEHQILANSMSEPGDSGSLVVDLQNRAVGLLFAGSASVTVITPIETVLAALNLTF
ncbi:MAG: S1 family peptidase [candidate division KSB1 bacterium]|nr:S1 family peptidase [candidate division KSB1 bacterium]